MVIFLDTETSGLKPGYICQLSYVITYGRKLQAKNFFFSVPFVEQSAYMVHGFSVEKLKILSNGKRFCDHMEEIENDFNLADLIVSHNTSFDFSFIRAEFERCGKVFCPKSEFCSMKKSVPICKLKRTNSAGYKYPKLAELSAFFGVTETDIAFSMEDLFNDKSSFHDARFDTTAMFLSVIEGISKGYFLEIKEKL